MLSDISQEKEVEEKNCLNKPMSMEKFTPNFKNDKCFLAVFLSHGKDGSIVMKKGLLNIADNILQHFRGDSCKNLLEKPKIFIFGVSISILACLIVCQWNLPHTNRPNAIVIFLTIFYDIFKKTI